MKDQNPIKVQVELSPDTSKRLTEACLKILKRRERQQEAAGRATA